MMNIKNHYLLIFALLFVTIKWSISFYYFPEALDTKILHDSVDDAKYYYPLIKFLSQFNLSYSYDPEINNLKIIPLPFWGIFIHSLFLKFFGFYSFILLDFFCLFIALLIFYHIFKMFFSKELSIIFSIIIFLSPYIISNSFLSNIQYLYLFGETFYNLRVPRPMITNLYFFGFILISLKLVTGKFYDIRNFFLLGLLMAFSLSSFYYHFFVEALLLLFILFYRFKFKFFSEIINNFKYFFILILTFLLFSAPFFINLYFHETDFTYRQCVFNLDWNLKIQLLSYFLSKYFSLNGIIFIIFLSFLTLVSSRISFISIIDKKIINFFYISFLASLVAPLFFVLISPKACLIYHFVNFTILNSFLFLIIYFLIILKILFKFDIKNYYNFLILIIFILSISFFTFHEYKNIKLKKDSEIHVQYRNELNLVSEKIEENFNLEDISLLTFEPNIMIWSIMKNIKYLDLNKSIFTSKKDFMIEDDIFSAFKKIGLNESNFELFIKNQKNSWRYMNFNITKFTYYKYQANSLITYKKSLDFEKDELEHINKTHPLLQQQVIIPRFELSRLKESFLKFDKNLYYPEVIVLNKKDDFFDFKKLKLNKYCKIIDGRVFLLYFKDKNKSCNVQ